MGFEQEYEAWLSGHLLKRSGERKGRLARGHQFAEKKFLQHVWWPLFGSFTHLHPEYEVFDWNRKSQFLDFAYLPPNGRFGLECDGYQAHVKDLDREAFSYALNRDTFLTGTGWKMAHFSFDDVNQRPEVCRMLLQTLVGALALRNGAGSRVIGMEREVLRYAWRAGRAVRPKEVGAYFAADYRTVRNWMRALVEKQYLVPLGSGQRVHFYEVGEAAARALPDWLG